VTIPVSQYQHTLHAIPDPNPSSGPSWTFAEAAALGATLPVAYGALRLRAGLRLGDTVLIHAAAGGLGLAAVQLCVALGFRVIGTAGSAAKCRVAERFGALRCINYNESLQWWDDVRALTSPEQGGQGRGVDVVFDPVGLVGDSLRCLADRGRILIVGFAGREGDMEALRMNKILLKQATVLGYVSRALHPFVK
jgi:NADPH:quinone reductase